MLRALPVALATLLGTLAALPAADARPPIRLAVLYFDNHTDKRDFDVLGKGLADMMVTDLSRVSGLQVVEREKLQALVKELRLQRSSLVDPKTAQKIGKVVGASHAVTGAITAFEPRLRIDIRLIEVSSGKVVMADKVVGRADQFFGLQQQLVQKFVAGLRLRNVTAPEPTSRVDDLKFLLEYARSLDAADRGDLKDATQRLQRIVARAPDFQLAQSRYLELLMKLKASKHRRAEALSSGEQALVAHISSALKVRNLYALKRKEVLRHMGYRVLDLRYRLFKLGQAMGMSAKDMRSVTLGPQGIPAKARSQVIEMMKGYVGSGLAFVTELDALGSHAKFRRRPSSSGFRADAQDRKRGAELGLGSRPDSWSFATPLTIRRAIASFILLGEPGFWSDFRYKITPPLASLDPKAAASAWKLLDASLSMIESGQIRKGWQERELIQTLDLYGEGLLRHGRKAEAIAKWQAILDRFPTHKDFAKYEEKIETALGVSAKQQQARKQEQDFQEALESCDPTAVLQGVGMNTWRWVQKEGTAALVRVVGQVEKACGTNDRFKMMMPAFYYTMASVAVSNRDCAFAAVMRKKMASAGARSGTEVWKIQDRALRDLLARSCPK